MTIEVTPAALRSAGAVWTEQGDQLRGAAAGLDQVVPAAVGPRAAGALEGYATHWADRVRTMQATSQSHGRALTDAADEVDRSDDDAGRDLTSLRGLVAGPATGGA